MVGGAQPSGAYSRHDDLRGAYPRRQVALVCSAGVAHLWPCNLRAWDLFMCRRPRCRVGGMGNATGLDYSAVQAVMCMQGVGQRQRAGLLQAVRECEAVALAAWDEKRPSG